jgi:hypothetical protein
MRLRIQFAATLLFIFFLCKVGMGAKWSHRSIHERVSNAKLPQVGGDEMIVYDVKSCDCCQSSIARGLRWVREKIYDPRSDGQNPAYRHFHAEPFGGLEGSC